MEKAQKYQSPENLYGSLFEAVQLGAVFPDSKTFTDCSPKSVVSDILAAYATASKGADFDLKSFVLEHFSLPIDKASTFISDTSHTLEVHIESLWPVLSRAADDPTAEGTLIPLPYPYVVPGGRFGEIYYWDSYFTQLGLRASGRVDLIRQMVDNFAYLIDTLGYIPNGNRTYFLGRSQPPFFSLMVALLAEIEAKSGIEDTLSRYIEQLDAEYAFWMEGAANLKSPEEAHRRVVLLDGDLLLNRYWDDKPLPRPESFREDVETAHASDIPNGPLYTHIRAACESGWDFSSRWGASHHLNAINTTDILPVDLNCLLWHLEDLLAKAHTQQHDGELALFFENAAAKRKKAIQTLFFDEKLATFTDYNFVQKKSTALLSAAMAFPLFFDLHSSTQGNQVCAAMKKHLLRPGGIVTSPYQTGQQWDAPNGWAPLQWIAFVGARKAGDPDLAETIRVRWLLLATKIYKKTGKMLEKYNVEDLTLEAGGGEYPVQDGFGWTNGVTLAFYNMEI